MLDSVLGYGIYYFIRALLSTRIIVLNKSYTLNNLILTIKCPTILMCLPHITWEG